MSNLLDQFLGCDEAGMPTHRFRHWRSADGIDLFLTSNAQDDALMLVSSPGELPDDEAHALNQSLWHHTLMHPTREGVRLSVVIPPGSTRVLLMDVWPRYAIHPDAFTDWREEHTQRHRHWRETLVTSDDEHDLDDLDDLDDVNGIDDRGDKLPVRPFDAGVPPERLA